MSSLVQQALRRAYSELIADRRKQAPFWMLVGFLPTYLIARFIVRNDPTLSLNVHDVHIHHFTYGIFVLSIVGFVAIAIPKATLRLWLALLYGIGLALVFDEFAMWIHLTSNYNLDMSEDVMAGILVFLVLTVYFTGIVARALRYLPYTSGRFAKKKSH